MDYYKILGVSQNSSQEEIKKAYRQKVKLGHPDAGGDVEEFKKIQEAYNVLSDPQKRSEHDNPQAKFNSQSFAQGNPFGDADLSDLFEQFGFRNQTRPKNRDITLQAEIDLADVYNGKDLVLQYRLQSGKIETVTVNVPPGANNGDTVRYEGLGDDGQKKFNRGDLHVRIKVRDDRDWKRNGNNVTIKRKINVFDLLLGCAIIIETLDNKKVKLNVPKGTEPGKILSISGYGLPDLRSRGRGNLYVQIQAAMPEIDDKDLLKKLEDIKNNIKE